MLAISLILRHDCLYELILCRIMTLIMKERKQASELWLIFLCFCFQEEILLHGFCSAILVANDFSSYLLSVFSAVIYTC